MPAIRSRTPLMDAGDVRDGTHITSLHEAMSHGWSGACITTRAPPRGDQLAGWVRAFRAQCDM